MQILIKNVDRTNYYKTGSLSLNLQPDGQSDGSISLVKPYDDDSGFFPECGQEIHILPWFKGIIHTVSYEKIECGLGTDRYVEIQINVFGYSNIPQRRTVYGSWDMVYAGEIVRELLKESLLAQEGITAGVIQQGAFLAEYDVYTVSIKDILDELAEKSSYKWFIDGNKQLFFCDEVEVQPTQLKIDENQTGENYIDFANVKYETTLEDYHNKVFVVGGISDEGHVIRAVFEDVDEIQNQQQVEGGGSGVYGHVILDESIEDVEVAMEKAIKEVQRRGRKPSTLSFTTLDTRIAEAFMQNTRKMYVNIPTIGLNDRYFTINSVQLTEVAPEMYQCEVKCEENATAYMRQDFIAYYNKKFKELKKRQEELARNAVKGIRNVTLKDDKLEIKHSINDVTTLNLGKDGSGRIIKITNQKTNKSITIDWE